MPYAYMTGDNCYGRGDYYRGDYYRGDPGILKSLFKGVVGAVKGFVTGGPMGAITGAGKALIRQAVVPMAAPSLALQGPPLFGGGLQVQGAQGLVNIQTQTGAQQPVGTMTPQGFIPGLCGMKGTHPNRSSYFRAVPGNPTQAVLIPKGSVCVRNRRLNVANPRALRRAIRRAQGFAKLARRVISFTGGKVSGRGRFKKKRR